MGVKRFHEEGAFPCGAGRNTSVEQSCSVFCYSHVRLVVASMALCKVRSSCAQGV